jgi:hypothetical protein
VYPAVQDNGFSRVGCRKLPAGNGAFEVFHTPLNVPPEAASAQGEAKGEAPPSPGLAAAHAVPRKPSPASTRPPLSGSLLASPRGLPLPLRPDSAGPPAGGRKGCARRTTAACKCFGGSRPRPCLRDGPRIPDLKRKA